MATVQPKFQLFAEVENKFYLQVMDAHITFNVTAQCQGDLSRGTANRACLTVNPVAEPVEARHVLSVLQECIATDPFDKLRDRWLRDRWLGDLGLRCHR